MARKKKINLLDLKIRFNDIFMREAGLDYDDNNHVYNIETDNALVIKEKFLKYGEFEYPVLNHNEIDFNLLENPKLCESLFMMWATEHLTNTVVGLQQCAIPGSNKGYFVMSFVRDGMTVDIKSEPFINESVRIFNLLCKILHREHLYTRDLETLDIKIERKDKK